MVRVEKEIKEIIRSISMAGENDDREKTQRLKDELLYVECLEIQEHHRLMQEFDDICSNFTPACLYIMPDGNCCCKDAIERDMVDFRCKEHEGISNEKLA